MALEPQTEALPISGGMVIDPDGDTGTVFGHVKEEGRDKLLVRLEQGTLVLLALDQLQLQEDGRYRSSLKLAQASTLAGVSESGQFTIPVIREELAVSKRVIESSGVRISKRVQERTEMVDLPLMNETVEVNRVSVNSVVPAGETPSARQEGDTWIFPILEEVVVMEKRLLLKEELHVTRTRQEVHKPQEVVLRSEEVIVEPLAPPSAFPDAPSSQASSH